MEDPFYSFSPDTKLPWVSSSSEMYAPMAEMDFNSSTEGEEVSDLSLFPFKIVQIDSNTIAIVKGTVNTTIPKISGTPLNDDYTLNTINITGFTTFWLKATLNVNQEITDVLIQTATPNSDTETQTRQVLGSLTWDSNAIDVISSNLGGSQNVDSCGAFHSWNRI